eukprot:1524529-Rhodomonas_salina.2
MVMGFVLKYGRRELRQGARQGAEAQSAARLSAAGAQTSPIFISHADSDSERARRLVNRCARIEAQEELRLQATRPQTLDPRPKTLDTRH